MVACGYAIASTAATIGMPTKGWTQNSH